MRTSLTISFVTFCLLACPPPVLPQTEFKIKASDLSPNDQLGSSVSISGQYALVGTRRGNGGTGSAYIFERRNDGWHEQAKLLASDGREGDEFGMSVALSGEVALVGARSHNSRGAVYVFKKEGGVWNEITKIEMPDGGENAWFGAAVALDGEHILVGAPKENIVGLASGAAYIFELDGRMVAKLTASDAAEFDQFGQSVAISDDFALVGASFHDHDGGQDAGAAYVFKRVGQTWQQQPPLTANDGAKSDRFGFSVTISGEVAAVGAPFDDSFGVGGNNAGAVYIFEREQEGWRQHDKLLASDADSDDEFGTSMRLSENTLLVGAQFDKDNGTNSGSATLFIRKDTTWTELAKLLASRGEAGDRFGFSVSLDGNLAMVGTPFDDEVADRAGAAYIYDFAPAIEVDPMSPHEENEDIPIQAKIAGISTVEEVTLMFRPGGRRAFDSVGMVRTDSLTYQGTIRAEHSTSRGIEYFILAQDVDGRKARLPRSGIFSLPVSIPGEGKVKRDSLGNPVPQPGGSEATAYRLISVPLDLDEKDPAAVLEDDLGPFDDTKWRFVELRPENQQLVDFPDTFFDMEPGRAFWLIVKETGKSIDTGPGVTNPSNREFAIPLHPGWNFVGDPFDFDIPFANLRLKSGNTPDIRFYAGRWSQASSPLRPFEGYAVANRDDVVDTLFVNPQIFAVEGTGTNNGSLPEAAFDSWSIRIRARCHQALDGDTKILVHQQASHELDNLDRPEPPVIGDFITAYFPHPEWGRHFDRYSTDARPELVDGDVWDIEVITNIRDKVHLIFEGQETVPAGFEVWLVDKATGLARDLRSSDHYEFAGSESERRRRLKVVVGRPEFIRQHLAHEAEIPADSYLSQNYPNPFNPVTTIRFGLPAQGRVTLAVFNILGERVQTLVDDEAKDAGNHASVWDGRDLHGRLVASGVYFVRMRAGQFAKTQKMLLVQ